ncbi:glycosyltransferase family 15 protein [Pholiota conissans]|uniref:Glycosyltransferase family 15 protein n=1 Tax=Pholiota conissans TaxID=109636 RepID=A0A9P6CQ34_9AGAR|nr:glycosyltransferase family 15 protein [Pholiota conissans]
MVAMIRIPPRLLYLAIALVLFLHYLAGRHHDEYNRVTSVSHLMSKIYPSPLIESNSNADSPIKRPSSLRYNYPNDQPYSDKRANATFVILCRNDQLWDIVRTVREVEDRFNRIYHYPYVFLNEVPFSDNFKSHIATVVSSKVEFGLIPREHWYQPDWIDEKRASQARDRMQSENIVYGGSLSYRNMCRFNSGFFFRHPLMQKYKWYWRIEPSVNFHCDILFDPFRYMEDNNKTYAFTISMVEYEATIPSLWPHIRAFIDENPQYIAPDNSMGFISDYGTGERYNLCHFWSNFEIADLDFWRGEAYMKFFEYLDSKGGFYYERWGDAPVHSIAAALFAPRESIQFFDEIGYEHPPYTHCPKEGDNYERGRCSCDPANNFDREGISCLNKFIRFNYPYTHKLG